MTGQRVGYIRVSSLDPKTVHQLDGVVLDRVFTDHASGKDQNRPALENLIDFVRDGDTVVVHSMDRLARHLEDLRSIVHRLTAKKVRVEFIQENLLFTDEDTAMTTLLLNVMGAFARFERSLIRERQREGIVLAKQRNAYKGRAPSLSPDQAAELCRKADAGVPKAALAREFGISRETVYTYLRARDREAESATALEEKTVEGLPADTRPRPTLTQYDDLWATPPTHEY